MNMKYHIYHQGKNFKRYLNYISGNMVIPTEESQKQEMSLKFVCSKLNQEKLSCFHLKMAKVSKILHKKNSLKFTSAFMQRGQRGILGKEIVQ